MTKTLQSKRKCSHCQSGPETFWYMQHRYLFDVDLAREIVNDGREPVEVDDESVRFSVETSEIYKPHLRHVNVAYPGIIAHIRYTTDEGELIKAHLLIDGHHRAARCLQLGRPFFACLLTEEESQAILLRSPARPVCSLIESRAEATAQ